MNRDRIRSRRIPNPATFRKSESWTVAEDRALLRKHTALVANGVTGSDLWIALARKHSRTFLGVQQRYMILTTMARRIRELQP